MSVPLRLRQERDFGQKLNATFTFAVQNFKPLSLCLLYLVAPVALIAGIVSGLYQSKLLSFFGSASATPTRNDPDFARRMFTQFFTADYWAIFVFSALSSIVLALTVAAYLVEYEASGGYAPTPAAVWGRVRSQLINGIGASIIAAVTVIVGIVFFVLPGIYAGVTLSLSFMVLMQEKASVFEAIMRPFRLINGKWWSTFGLLFVTYFIVGFLGYIFQLPAGLVAILNMLHVIPPSASYLIIITTMISTLGTTLLHSLVSLAVGFQYYNLVEKKEGVGLLDDINQLGQSTPRGSSYEEGDF